MKKIALLIIVFSIIIIGCEKQYSPEETQNLLQEHLLTIVADFQDWQLQKITDRQFKEKTRTNLKKIENILDRSTASEAQKRIYRNTFEMYYNLLN